MADPIREAALAALHAIVRSTEYVTVPHEAELALALHNLRAALAAPEPQDVMTAARAWMDARHSVPRSILAERAAAAELARVLNNHFAQPDGGS